MRSRWALVASLAVLGALAAKSVARTALLRQTSEGDGHREPEYGLFGYTLYQPRIDVPGLNVSDDFRAELAKTGLTHPPVVEAEFGKAVRTMRPKGTQYWLRVNLEAEPDRLAEAYLSQLTDVRRLSTSGRISGVCPDERTRVRLLVNPMPDGRVDFLLTFGPGS